MQELCANCYAGKGSYQHIGALKARGFIKWKNAIEAFNEHNHKGCTELTETFLKVSRGEQLSVAVQVHSKRSRQAAENRLKLISIIRTILLCGRQGLPLCSGSDSRKVASQDLSVNSGNFQALLQFRVQAGDTVLQKCVEGGPLNAQYVSLHIQNELVEVCGDIIKEKIVQRANTVNSYALIVDEITNITKTE